MEKYFSSTDQNDWNCSVVLQQNLLIFLPHIYLLVGCQRPDFTLITDNDKVMARLRGCVNLRWNIIKENDTDQFISANLHLLGHGLLFGLDPSTQKPVPVSTRKIFGDRIECHIADGKTYICTLQNLTYSDTNFFMLEVGVRRGEDTSILRRAKIDLLVLGMEQLYLFVILDH